MAIKTDVTKLSDEFTKQITEVVKKAAGKHPYLCELKKQTSQSTLIHIFYMDRDDMRAMVGTALKKNGMNFTNYLKTHLLKKLKNLKKVQLELA